MSHYVETKNNRQIHVLNFTDNNIKFYLVCHVDGVFGDYVCVCEDNDDNRTMLSSKKFLQYFILEGKLIVYLSKVRIVNPNFVDDYQYACRKLFNKSYYFGLFYNDNKGVQTLIKMYKTSEFKGDSFNVLKVVLQKFDYEFGELITPSVSYESISLWDLFKYPLNSYAKAGESQYTVEAIGRNIFDNNLKDTLDWFKIDIDIQ